jgi:hypothetical protein
VTTGTKGTSPASPLTIQDFSFKSWSGANGKYQVYAGENRVKWNNYSLTSYSGSVKHPTFTLTRTHKFLPLSPGDPGIRVIPVGWRYGGVAWNDYPISNNLKNKAFDKLLEKVKGHQFNLGVETGQARQTVGLLSENLRKLGKAALALRRGDFATAARQLGASPRGTRLKPSDISGRWLELQYGWLPLISSSYEAATAFAEISNGPRHTLFRVRRREGKSFELSTSPTDFSMIVPGYGRRQIQYEMYEEMSVQRQLGLYDPLSIAWELTPWSFVVDWFVPFGTYLSNLNQIPKLKGRWLVTDTLKAEITRSTAQWLDTAYWGANWNPPTVLVRPILDWGTTMVTRTFSASPPPVPLPNFQFGVNTPKRFWNAVSLAHQRFKGKS